MIFGESKADWKRFLSGVLAYLEPFGVLETALVEQIASTMWRRARLIRYETSGIRNHLDQTDELAELVVKDRFRFRAPRDPDALVAVLAEWKELDDSAPLNVEVFLELTWVLTPDRMDVGGIAWPAPGGRVDGYNGWTVGQVREGIGELARISGSSAEEIIAAARRRAECGVLARDLIDSEIEDEATKLKRGRVLGPIELTDRIIRLEAHLTRILTRDLNQLEALKAQRQGMGTPLLRVDLNGAD